MLKRLLKEVKNYTFAAVLTPLWMLLEVAMEMVIPLLMARIIDDGINAGNMNMILKVGGIMLIAALIGLLGGIMGAIFGAKASTGFAKNLREAMFKNIQTFSFENIDKFSTAGLVTRLTTDVTNIQNSFQMMLRMGMRAPASLIVAMIMAFSINARLASVYLGAVVILVIIIFFVMKATRVLFKILMEKYDGLNAQIQENVSGIRVVKAYVREAYENSKMGKAAGQLYDASVNAEKLMAVNMPIMSAMIYTCMLLISWLGAKFIVAGDMTTGELTSMFAYCMTILMNLLMLAVFFVMFTMSIASMERITEVLNEEATIKNKDNPVFEVKNGSITFKDVVFGYNKTAEEPVLNHVNLDIKAGETIGIIGSTGSAKTTLVAMISRLYDVDEGQVTVGGIDVRDYDVETIRNEVSVVLQNNVLFSGSILDNLRWGDPDASEEDCVKACKLACADEFITRFPEGYNTHIEQGGTNVSGGQRQRLCIARALLKKPKILILDDSTSAVDTATDANIRRAFREEIPGTTKLIIAQRISSVQDADRIIVMNDGKIDDFGTHDELLARNDIYKDIYEVQVGQGGGDFDEQGGEE
ncbi:MAG: ABC transporter ATP-binding protein [Pseudobutyrivibrio sp.]|nr:ABC transporter ATP-binding protein [Pseudobutyrivibrio sp.]